MLNEKELSGDLYKLFTDLEGKDTDSKQEFADRLAAAICKCIKTGEVTIDAGIEVKTTGSAAAQTGATTQKGKGKVT